MVSSFDGDDSEEWAWTFSVAGQSVCLSRTTNNNLPWQAAVSQPIDFSTSKAQIRLNIDAWEKDAPGPPCVWEHGDEARQRMQDNVAFDLLSLNFGQQIFWTQKLIFVDRPNMSGDQGCSTVIEGQLLKRDTNYMATPSSRRLLPLLLTHI